jgi:hypothetical protein
MTHLPLSLVTNPVGNVKVNPLFTKGRVGLTVGEEVGVLALTAILVAAVNITKTTNQTTNKKLPIPIIFRKTNWPTEDQESFL